MRVYAYVEGCIVNSSSHIVKCILMYMYRSSIYIIINIFKISCINLFVEIVICELLYIAWCVVPPPLSMHSRSLPF